MSKISTYDVAPVPKLADKLIGTSVGGTPDDGTYNFTLQELLTLFLPNIPANNLQGVLDYGNTAIQDINLTGTIYTTDLDVSSIATILDSFLTGDTHITGGLFDVNTSIGTAGQVLTSTGFNVEWYTIPTVIPDLQQVLTAGNTSTLDIILTSNLSALDVSSDTATFSTDITIDGTLTDGTASVGTAGKVLSSTGTGVQWVSLPVYSATSPLFFDSNTGVFSIQVANGTQDGYLTSADWITFNGKQNAGNYITALTGEATATGPGSVAITLSNTAVIGKILTGLSITGAAITSTDTILQAFGKAQNQINGKQDTITLTTTGTSGASTLIGATLNIPNYADGGVLSLSAIGATPNANAATITGTVLNLQPANASFGGVVTTGTQTFAGAKTLNVDLTVNGLNIGKGNNSIATNTSIGVGALASNNTGLVNTAIGNSTLSANTDGNFNTAVGFGSLQSNTTGSSNSALGYVSLSANISAGQNSAFGNLSLTVNTTGGSNTALGYSALTDNISGSNNIGIGYNSGGTLTTGSNNTFIGANVVSSSSSLANNILIGNGSGAVKAQHDGTNWTFTGGATITGQLSLGSTITNGTYTYTLPSATGTLALVGGVGVGTVTSVSFTLGSSGTDLNSSVTNSTTTPAITLNVPTASASARGALSAADWTTFNSKQIAGNYITSLTGEATALGPGAAAVTLTNSAVIAKVLTGLNVTGGTVIAADTILAAFGKVQNQINGLIGGSIFQGVWNASTNTPALVSSVGTNGYYYIVNVAGSTNLDGITDWKVGDWAIFAGTSWQKVDNTDAVSSVNGFTGAVSLTTDNVPEGATNLYFTNTRARTAISLTTTGSSGASTYDNTTGIFNIPNYIDAFVGTVTSVGLSSATSGVTIGSTPITTSGTITIAIATATASQNGLLSSTDWTTFNSKQDTITLTTTGTSGASTFIGNTLNIPDYGGALTGYLPLAGGTMTGNINWGQTDRGLTWSFNTDGASIKFYNTGDGDTDSRLEFATSDNNDEYFRWGHLPSGGGPFYESMKLLPVSSGNAELIVSGKIIKSGGTSAQFLKADGSVDSTTYQGAITLTTTGTSGPSTLIGNTLNIPDYIGGGVLSLSAIGSTPNANAATITGTVLNLQPADASFGGVLKAVDWVTFNSKQDAITLTTTGTSGAATFIANTLNIPNYAPSAAARNEQTFTATSGQTVFSIAYTVGQLDVYYNGSKLSPAEFTATNGTSFTLATACQLNDIVDAVAYITTAGLGGGGTINTIPKFTASTTIGDSAITDDGTTVTLVSRALSGTSANFTGQLTLGSTITNGTYTYSLPSATGILALTSDIHSAVTLSAIGGTANANGATLTGQVLNLQPADASFGGVVTTGTQTFAGAKTFTSALAGTSATFSGNIQANNASQAMLKLNFTGTGAINVSLSTYANTFAIYDETNTRSIINFAGNTDILTIRPATTLSGALSGTSATFTSNDSVFGNTSLSGVGLRSKSASGGITLALNGRNNAGIDDNFLIFYKFDGTTTQGRIYARSNIISIQDATATDVLSVTAGAVGIGTTSPNGKLDVSDSTAGAVTRGDLSFDIGNALGSNYVYLGRTSATAGNYTMTRFLGRTGTSDIYAQISGSTSAPHYFLNCNVGIGTSSPLEKLQVSGAITATGAATNAIGSSSTMDFTSGNTRLISRGVDASTQGAYQFRIETSAGSGSSALTISNSGAVTIAGSLSKGSGSFRIEHPLPSLSETHQLVHSFIEGPQADLIYRGKLTLVNGKAQANIDEVSTMTEGTFEALCREVQCFTTNESGWDLIKGKVIGNIIYIESQNESSTDEISWMVIGERKDKHMMETEWTDENGKVIVEPLKPIEPEPIEEVEPIVPIEPTDNNLE